MTWADIVAAVLCLVLPSSLLGFAVSARLLRDFYDGSTWNSLRHHLGILFHRTNGFTVVENGRVVYPTSEGQRFGPRLIISRPGNAALLERGNRQRVVGASVFASGRFEYVKLVFDLREQQQSLTFDDVLTREMICTTVKTTVAYSLEISDAARGGAEQPSAAEQAALRQLPYTMPDWPKASHGAVENSLRQVISTVTLTDLLSAAHLEPLERRMLHLANVRTLTWGVRIHHVIIECLQPTGPVTAATTGRWIAGTESETLLTNERARALATREMLQLIAQGYAIAKGLGMDDHEIHREVLRRTLEQLARDPATKVLVTRDVRDLLGLE